VQLGLRSVSRLICCEKATPALVSGPNVRAAELRRGAAPLAVIIRRSRREKPSAARTRLITEGGTAEEKRALKYAASVFRSKS
jgi:hypothetical protein